jgi:hypothetical protein
MVAQCFGENAGLLGNYRIADLTVSGPKGRVRAAIDGDHLRRNRHGILDVNAKTNATRITDPRMLVQFMRIEGGQTSGNLGYSRFAAVV